MTRGPAVWRSGGRDLAIAAFLSACPPVRPSALLAQCPDGTPPPCARVAAPARATAPVPGSLAVLPFVNRSPDTADAYLAEALPEQIVGRLGRVPGIQIKSSTAVAAQWRRTPDPMAAARALRVEWFVTGSLRRAGRQLSVSAELVRSATGDGAWAAPFRRGDDDLAAVEEQIAESVAVAVVGRLAPAAAAQLRRSPTRNIEAYRLYLNGVALLRRRVQEDVRRAVSALTEAVQLDPQFAAAWARLSMARIFQFSWQWNEGVPPDSLLALSGAAAARALALDSSLAEAWMADGTWASQERDFARAAASLARALQLDSLNADIFHSAGTLYDTDGNLNVPGAAEPLLRRAVFLDPGLRNTWRKLGTVLLARGRLPETEAVLDTAISLGPWEPALTSRAWVRMLRRNGAGALTDVNDATRLLGADTTLLFAGLPTLTLRALVALTLGDSAPARIELTRLRALPDSLANVQTYRAYVASALGLREDALTALERHRAIPIRRRARCGAALCSTNLDTWLLLADPIFTPLHDDPRFQRLLAETRPHIPWLEGWR